MKWDIILLIIAIIISVIWLGIGAKLMFKKDTIYVMEEEKVLFVTLYFIFPGLLVLLSSILGLFLNFKQ